MLITSLVHRINWLRARARFHRWREEFNLLSHEMEWVTRYFLYQMNKWSTWQKMAADQAKPGHVCYAERQKDLWNMLAIDADTRFQLSNYYYKPLVM